MADGYSSDARGQIESAAPRFGANVLIAAAVVVAALYFGRDVFVPFVIAVLLSFVLAIPVRLLQSWGLGRRLPVAVVVVLAFLGLGALGAVVTVQLTQLAGDLPRYQSTIRGKIATLKGAADGSGPLDRAVDMLQSLADEFSAATPRPTARAPTGPDDGADTGRPEPLPVEIVNTRSTAVQTVSAYVGPLIHPLALASLTAVFVVFILMQRGDMRNRLIRLAGSQDLQRTTAAMNDAARRLSRLFLTQVLLNSSFGIVVGIGLWLIGVPSPILWGVMAALSRFIPYVGVVLAAGGPLVLAAAVDPNWTMLAWTAGFFAVMEFMVGQVVEPLLYGHSTGLSPVAVLASVTFWTLLWGPVGLILAVPLTVCLVVLGRHVEQLEFLEVMFGDRPPLTVAESFYQRMLAGDAGEAAEQAEEFLRDHAIATYYDEIAVKGLALAQIDLTRGALDPARLVRVTDTVSELMDDLSDHDDPSRLEIRRPEPKRASGDENLDETLDEADQRGAGLPVLSPDGLAPEWRGPRAVLCIAGRNELDRACAAMLAQILGKHGLGAVAEGADAVSAAGVHHLPSAETRIVCLSYLDTSSPVHVRYAVRRVRRRLPGATVIVGSWGLGTEGAGQLCEAARSDRCASRLLEATGFCLEAAAAASIPASPAALTDTAARRAPAAA